MDLDTEYCCSGFPSTVTTNCTVEVLVFGGFSYLGGLTGVVGRGPKTRGLVTTNLRLVITPHYWPVWGKS